MMRYGVAFTLADVFFTHYHTDHLLGVVGLMRTMSLQGRTDPLRLWGPKGGARVMKQAVSFGADRLAFPVEIQELDAGVALARAGYEILPFPVDHHGANAVGYALVEHTRLGRFNPDQARALGIPEGPLWGRLHRGETVTLPDGRSVQAASLVGPTRAGRRVVISGDTRPCEATVEAAQGADLLVHEATFAEEDAERARETGHSTGREAATVAARAGVKRLALTHFSARYSRDPGDVEREARAAFPQLLMARDGMEIDVPFEIEEAELIDGDALSA
jgi:ribonuclease Z